MNQNCTYLFSAVLYTYLRHYLKRKNITCTVGQIKKKRNTLIYSNTNYRTEVKLVPVIMDYCLLQYNALKFFLGFNLHGWSEPNFNFFYVNPQICQRDQKVRLTNWLEKFFHNIFNISLRVIRRNKLNNKVRKIHWGLVIIFLI